LKKGVFMKVLGISGSPRDEKTSNVYRLVKTILEASELEYELISLRGKKINGCIACLQCAGDNICKVNDDMKELREKIVEADAYVIGSPNYYSGINGITHAFLERWYQFRHQEGDYLWGKLAVLVATGGTSASSVINDMEKFCLYNFIEPIAKVEGIGAAACFTCGYGETCKVGVPYFLYGEGVKITEDIIPDITKQPEVIEEAKKAGKLLREKLTENYDRMEVAKKMQQKMMEAFKSST
jgi:multimeric flavodoxin WrbA